MSLHPRPAAGFLAVALLLAGCKTVPDYVVINKRAVETTPKKVILIPFIIDKRAKAGRSGEELARRGLEAPIVVRDELEPYFLEGMRKRLAIPSYVEPETVGVKSAQHALGDNYYQRVTDLIRVYAQNSAVDPRQLASLIDAVDPQADGIIFVRIDEWGCRGGKWVEIGMRGYFFIKDRPKAAWIAQDSAEQSRAHQGGMFDECDQPSFRKEGAAKLDLFLSSMPFQRGD